MPARTLKYSTTASEMNGADTEITVRPCFLVIATHVQCTKTRFISLKCPYKTK